MTITRTRRTLLTLVAAAVVVTASLGIAFVHDNPAGLTRIADINTGAVAPGENVTIKSQIVEVLILTEGRRYQILTLSDGEGTLVADWWTSPVHVGLLITARGTVMSNTSLGHLLWFERVWLFA